MYRTILLAGGMLASACAWAQQGPAFPPPTLALALQEALAADPGLAGARSALAAAPALRAQAGAIPNPELSALREGGDAAVRATTYQINQTVELGGKRAARVSAADQAQALAGAELALRGAELRANVTAAYHEHLAAAAGAAYAQQALVLANRAAGTVARRVQAGKVSPVENAKASLAASQARIEAAQAESALVAARQQLANLLGRRLQFAASASTSSAGPAAPPLPAISGAADAAPSPAGPADPALPELPPGAALEARFAASPELAKAQADAALAAALARVERSRQTPDVVLSVGSKREGEAQRRQGIIGISVPLPLFDRNQGKLAEALGRADAAQAELRAAAVRVEGEYHLALSQVAAHGAEARLIRDTIVPAAEATLAASTKGYEYGKFALIDVLDAQRTLVAARNQYIQSVREAWRAYARLERILGPENKDHP